MKALPVKGCRKEKDRPKMYLAKTLRNDIAELDLSRLFLNRVM